MRRLVLALWVLGCGEPAPSPSTSTVASPSELPAAGLYCVDGTGEAHPLTVTLEVETDAGRSPAEGRVGWVCVRIGPGERPAVALHAVLNPPSSASALTDEPQEIHCTGLGRSDGVVEDLDCRRHLEQLGTGDTHCVYDVPELRVRAAPDRRLTLAPLDASFRGGGCSAWSTRAIHLGSATPSRIAE